MRRSAGVRRLLGALRRLGPRRPPRLSVVVPVFDMELFLAACLDSVLAQSFVDVEVIVVIDGATDRSLDIAREYARADRRVRVLHQPNAGLGAARNAGVAVARGTYLSFVDSDDTIPPDAYAHLVGTLERTGSDLAIGTLTRHAGGRAHTPPLMRLNHESRREVTTLEEMPLILADVFPVNKVFRRSFWDDADLAFPVGIRYEDQPTLTQAFLASRTFDVIPEVVYHWHTRADRSSITQGRHTLPDLVDRLETKRISTAMVLEDGRPGLLDVWFRDVLPVDMWEYFRAAPSASDDYWETLRAGVLELWNESTFTFDRTRVPAQQRLMGWLVARDRREELGELIGYVDAHRGDVPVEVRDDHVVARLPGTPGEQEGPPRTTYVLGEHEQRWEARVTAATWQDAALALQGFALIRNTPTDGEDTELTGRLVPLEGCDRPHPLRLSVEHDPRATDFVGRPRQNFDACGFLAEVDLAALVPAPTGVSAWRFELCRRVRSMTATGGVAHLRDTDIDPAWHRLRAESGWAGQARLRDVGGELVLECRPD